MKIFKANGKLTHNIYFIVGSVFIAYIIFIRLILTRAPKMLNATLPLITKIIFIEIFAIFVLLIVNNLRIFLVQKKYYEVKSYDNESYAKLIVNKFKIISEFWSKSLITVHNFLAQTPLSNCFNYLGAYLPMYFGIYKTHYLTIIFIMMPKTVVLAAFLVDVFIFAQLNHFYMLGSLLLIPVSYQYLCYAITEDALNGIIECDNYLIITDKQTNKVISAWDYFKMRRRYAIRYSDTFDFSEYLYTFNDDFLKDSRNNKDINYSATLSQFMTTINTLIDIASYMLQIKVWQEDKLPGFNLMLYGGYCIGWAYVLLHIF